MPKRPQNPQGTNELQPAPPARRYRIERYRRSRYWALYEGKELMALTVYKRGAKEVLTRLQARDQQLAEQEAPIATLTQAGATAPPQLSPLA